MTHTAANHKPFDGQPDGRRGDRFDEPERYVGYAVCDPRGRKIGSTVEIFLNDSDEPEYIKVRIGTFGLKTVLIPVSAALVNEERRTLMLQ